MAAVPPELEALDRLRGELCISHQLAEIALRHAASEAARAELEHHQRAIEDLGFELRVLQAEVAGTERAAATPDTNGRGKLGYGEGHVHGAEQASFGSALSSLSAELSIAAHQGALAEEEISRPEVTAIRDELRAFQATVRGLEKIDPGFR